MNFFARLKRKPNQPAPASPAASSSTTNRPPNADAEAKSPVQPISPAHAALLATLADVILTTFKSIRRMHDAPRERLRTLAACLERLQAAAEALGPASTPGRGLGGGEVLDAALRECEEHVRGAALGAVYACDGKNGMYWSKFSVQRVVSPELEQPFEGFAAVLRAVPRAAAARGCRGEGKKSDMDGGDGTDGELRNVLAGVIESVKARDLEAENSDPCVKSNYQGTPRLRELAEALLELIAGDGSLYRKEI